MRRRIPLKNVWWLLLCALLIGIPCVAASVLCEQTIVRVSHWSFQHRWTTVTVGNMEPATSRLSSAITTILVAGFILGMIAVIPLTLLSAALQMPPHRFDRAIRRAPRALVIGGIPVLAVDYMAWVKDMLSLSNLEIFSMVAFFGGPLICLWIDALLHRFNAHLKRRDYRRRHFCRSCGYDLRRITSARCPECGSPRFDRDHAESQPRAFPDRAGG